ncbi:MAG: TlpA disulfide reductase family protein [Nitrosomonadales bacterium]|jgi:peroxiredoxin
MLKNKFLLIFISLFLIVALYSFLLNKQTIPTFKMTSINGEVFYSNHQENKITIYNFWATDCPTCIKEMPGLVNFYNTNKANINLYAIAMFYDPPSRVLTFSTKNNLPFPVVIDYDKLIINNFPNVTLTPTTIIVDKQGKITNTIIGELNFSELSNQINNLL